MAVSFPLVSRALSPRYQEKPIGNHSSSSSYRRSSFSQRASSAATLYSWSLFTSSRKEHRSSGSRHKMYNCLLGESDIPRALKLSRLNRRVRAMTRSFLLFFSLLRLHHLVLFFYCFFFGVALSPVRDSRLAKEKRISEGISGGELSIRLSCRNFGAQSFKDLDAFENFICTPHFVNSRRKINVTEMLDRESRNICCVIQILFFQRDEINSEK